MRKLLGLLGIALALSLTSCSERIDAGNEGILVKMYGSEKGVQDVSLVTGRVWYNPFTESVYEFPIYVQTYDYESFTVNAKDGSEFSVDPTLSFGVRSGMSPDIFKKYRKDIREITSTTLANHIKDAFRIEFNKYSTDEIISSREKFENNIQVNLSALLEKEGFYLEQMTSGMRYPKTITDAINSKNAMVQEAQKAENQARLVEAEAKKNIIQAEAEAKIRVITAESEAKANDLKKQSLSPMLIQQQFIEKWDGETPLYGESPVLLKNLK